MKKVFFICIILLINACGSNKNITVNQIQSKRPIIIHFDKEEDRVVIVSFPITFGILNHTNNNITLDNMVKYQYADIENYPQYWNTTIFPYLIEDEKLLTTINPISRSVISSKNKREYVIYTRHFIHSQNLFSAYLEKMRQENKDTLHIESIQQLKQINPNFVNDFLQGDSIRFLFYYDKKFHTIVLPVEVK